MEKDYSYTYLKRYTRAALYYYGGFRGFPPFVSHDPIQVYAIVRGVAVGVTAVTQLPARLRRRSKSADRASAYYHYTLGHMYAEQAGNKGDYLNKAIENYGLRIEGRSRALPSSAKSFRTSTFSPDACARRCRKRKRALRANPNDTERAAYSRPDLHAHDRRLAAGQGRREMLKKAIEQYTKIVDSEPKDIDTWLMLGRLQKIAQNSVEAEKAYKKVLEIDPNHEDALTGLAVVYADLGDSQRSSELLEAASRRRIPRRAP